MGGCYSCNVSMGGKVYDMEYEPGFDLENDTSCGHGYGGTRAMLRGASRFVSMYCQKGKKGDNQDALTFWEDFAGEKGTIFCGVFDGHGPLGHKFSECIRDNLPSKLSATMKIPQQKVSKHNHANFGDTCSNKDVYGEKNQNMSFASWGEIFVKSFNKMDQELQRNINTNGFDGGSTATTIIKKGDQLIVANLGDSRAILCTRTDDNSRVPIQLTIDMKPDIPSEAQRIINCGGIVLPTEEDPSVNRIWMPDEDSPGLAMSRAFGDFCLKDYGLTSVPDVTYRKISKQDEFVVLATDGIWDVLTNNEVINIVASAPKRSLAAKILVKHAVRAWSYKYPHRVIDDCSVICLFLDD